MAKRRESLTGQKRIWEQQAMWQPRGTEADLIYLAGFFDGEGSLGMYGRNYKLDVKVCGVDRRPIERFHEVFGFGTYRLQERKTKALRPVWEWSCNGTWAMLFLTTLLPHLVVKREQAQEALRVKFVRRGVPIPQEVLAERATIAAALRSMKKEAI